MNDPNIGIIQLVIQGGAVVVLVIACWLFLTGKIVRRGEYLDMVRERDGWRAMALHGMKVQEKAIEALKGPR